MKMVGLDSVERPNRALCAEQMLQPTLLLKGAKVGSVMKWAPHKWMALHQMCLISTTTFSVIITFDDVLCLLQISIHGKLVNHMAKISQNTRCCSMLRKKMILLLLSVNNMKGARIGFAWLKQILERRCIQAIQLENIGRSL